MKTGAGQVREQAEEQMLSYKCLDFKFVTWFAFVQGKNDVKNN